MQLKILCAWWGLDHLGIDGMLKKIKTAGFDGVETFIPENEEDRTTLRDLLGAYNLDVVAHQYQAAGEWPEFLESYERWIEHAASFKPLLINSHTGRDYWPEEYNGELVEAAESLSNRYAIPIVHETHRGRFLYSTSAARQYFKAHPKLRINADFSHWTCVSESLLQDQPEILEAAIQRTDHIHARVGHAQGPQITDPRAPEWKTEVAAFLGWWKRIVQRCIGEGREYLTITPEFGPRPYTATVPFTDQPVADFFEINCWMKDFLRTELGQVISEDPKSSEPA